MAIVVTAYAGGDTKAEALAAGAWQVLSKPVDFPMLLSFVDEALGQPLVMVVDDDHDLCANLWDLLRERGYRVCLAHDEKEAAERLKGREFKVVLIDMKLPDGDGTTVFRIVRQANPQARTIVITGHRSEMEQLVKQSRGRRRRCGLLQAFRCATPFVYVGATESRFFSNQITDRPRKSRGDLPMAMSPPLHVLVVEDDADTVPTSATSWNWTATASRPPAPSPRRSTATTGPRSRPSSWITGCPMAVPRPCCPSSASWRPRRPSSSPPASRGSTARSWPCSTARPTTFSNRSTPTLLRGSLARIAERQKLARAKERTEAAFRTLVEAAPSMIVILRLDHTLLYLSPLPNN